MEGYFYMSLPLLNETEKAYCFSKLSDYLDRINPTWIPKSQTIKQGDLIYVKNWLFMNLTHKQIEFIYDVEQEVTKKNEIEIKINQNTKVFDIFGMRLINGLYVWYHNDSGIKDISYADLKLRDLKGINLNKLLKYRNIGKKSINKMISVLSEVGVEYKFLNN